MGLQIQTYAYCIQNGLGYKIETMRYRKRDSIRAYMDLTFPGSDIKWENLTHDTLKCVKVGLTCLTQT